MEVELLLLVFVVLLTVLPAETWSTGADLVVVVPAAAVSLDFFSSFEIPPSDFPSTTGLLNTSAGDFVLTAVPADAVSVVASLEDALLSAEGLVVPVEDAADVVVVVVTADVELVVVALPPLLEFVFDPSELVVSVATVVGTASALDVAVSFLVVAFEALAAALAASAAAFSAAFSRSARSRSLSAAAERPPVFCCCSLCRRVVTPVVSESMMHCVCCCCDFCKVLEALVLWRDFRNSCL